ncbi:hypothetical protein XENOCAPTIV_008350 [Xenoophorus captivus]|uniref:Uncharacterized protein n=1 Tax=Xenoophorus captivus TaxID=1517983 RepID=A0ABV0QQM0_9TELE
MAHTHCRVFLLWIVTPSRHLLTELPSFSQSSENQLCSPSSFVILCYLHALSWFGSYNLFCHIFDYLHCAVIFCSAFKVETRFLSVEGDIRAKVGSMRPTNKAEASSLFRLSIWLNVNIGKSASVLLLKALN